MLLLVTEDCQLARPKFYRDPVHLQVRFDAVDLNVLPEDTGRMSWLCQKLIDTPHFQRLRFIRQNGLANLVFHGAEHSRFTHSIGVHHVAKQMYERICRNSSESESSEWKLLTVIAALLHDVGHGPFSHTLEEILKEVDVKFHHEEMTKRFISDPDSDIYKILVQIDNKLPENLILFFDKKMRKQDHWVYRVVSSQLDADRLDYVQRDALFAGLRGHGFDFERMLDLLNHHENRIAVDRGATEALESYLVSLDQLYRAIYYHHAVRSATQMLMSLMRRAVNLHRNGDRSIFASLADGEPHPICDLLEKGSSMDLRRYQRLTEYGLWYLIEAWQGHGDKILSELSARILNRKLLKTIEVDQTDFRRTSALMEQAKVLVARMYPDAPEAVEHFVLYDEPSRTSYKRYDWKSESRDESIWLVGRGKKEAPLEDDDDSTIIQSFKSKRYFPRLIVPSEVRQKLLKQG